MARIHRIGGQTWRRPALRAAMDRIGQRPTHGYERRRRKLPRSAHGDPSPGTSATSGLSRDHRGSPHDDPHHRKAAMFDAEDHDRQRRGVHRDERRGNAGHRRGVATSGPPDLRGEHPQAGFAVPMSRHAGRDTMTFIPDFLAHAIHRERAAHGPGGTGPPLCRGALWACGRPVRARGLCHAHLMRHYRGVSIDDPIGRTRGRKPAPPCECGARHFAHGKCRRCYDRARRRPMPLVEVLDGIHR